MKRILIADDSPTARTLLRHLLESQPDFQVVGVAGDGIEAVRLACSLRPDVATMDLAMPNLDGFEATRRIMQTCPIPIVVVSSLVSPTERSEAIRAMQAGAVAALPRPPGPGTPGAERLARELVDTIRTLSRVKVIQRRILRRTPEPTRMIDPKQRVVPRNRVQIVVVGASTGGPHALAAILAALRPDFSIPILVVQHITPGFVPGLRDWLDNVCPLQVVVPADGQPIRQGFVYLAPDETQMGVSSLGRIALDAGNRSDLHRPSVGHLFRSAHTAFGPAVAAVLLTGMGHDGAEELVCMDRAGAPTVLQDRATSTVWGMPGEAARLGARSLRLPLDEIGTWLNALRLLQPA